jgi:two-component system chemotaxis response regulator CheB
MAIKVLVVDDSALMRKHLADLLKGAGFDVAMARNGVEAVDQVVEWQPDVVSLDINMPEMDGLTALSLIMAARPTPTVMVSSLTTKGALATLEALAMGAVDFVAKPDGTISLSISSVSSELVQKIRAAAGVKLRKAALGGAALPPREKLQYTPPADKKAKGDFGLVLIGVSTGGPRTLEEILPLLPADFPWPVLVTQHMPGSFTGPFASRMDSLCALHVREVGFVEEIRVGEVYIARGGTDLMVSERAGKLVALSKPEASAYLWHPSVEVMVESAMKHLPAQRLIGVQLTGMGYDGAQAMSELKKRGGRTIAESEATAVVFGMPKELIDRGGASCVLPASEIATQLKYWTTQR